MAKIEIYETEKDVQHEQKRAALQNDISKGRFLTRIGFESGMMFGFIAAFSAALDKAGLTKAIRNAQSKSPTWKKVAEFPSAKLNHWLDKHWIAGNVALAGMFSLMGAVGLFKLSKAEKELNDMDNHKQVVIVPGDISTNTLRQVPAQPATEQTLRRVPAKQLQAHTESLLADNQDPSIQRG